MKTVFFGPFLGEFGWECSHWHAWVKTMCDGPYRSYRKIAASYPGREPFYPNVDEFWTHPDDFTRLKLSQRAYFTDLWIGHWPLGNDAGAELNHSGFTSDVAIHAEKLLSSYRARLPEDAVMFVPFKLNVAFSKKSGRPFVFGLHLRGNSFKTFEIPFSEQDFSTLQPTGAAGATYREINKQNKRIIAVFPRHRALRRPDKNWTVEQYRELIRRIQSEYPDRVVGIFGEAPGSYFTDGVPENCLDFINVDPKRRMDIQIAALKDADAAVGSVSGAMLIVLLAGCPVLEWGDGRFMQRTKENNFLKTPLLYLPDTNPSVEKVFNLMSDHFLKQKKSYAEIDAVVPVPSGARVSVKPSPARKVFSKLSYLWSNRYPLVSSMKARIHLIPQGVIH